MTETDPHAHLGYRPCVGIMVMNGNGLVWVGERKDAKALDGAELWWQMPQGGIEQGEEPIDAALRELLEETGITSVKLVAASDDWLKYDLPAELIGKVWGGKYRGQKQKWFLFRFDGADTEINLTSQEESHSEFAAWRWSPAHEVVEHIVPFKRAVYAEVMKIFAPHLSLSRS